MKRYIVTVFGSSKPRPGTAEYQLAYQLGQAIAAKGWVLCNGGYGGTMEASAKGAVEGGGQTIGVTCAALRRNGPNAYVREEIETSTLFQRLDKLIRLGSAYVVLPGGTGTLLELALALELLSKGRPKRKAPLILLGDYWEPVLETIRSEQSKRWVRVAEDVAAAVRYLVLAPVRRRRKGKIRDESPSSTA